MRYNYIYSDLYSRKHIKELILKNIDVDKYYKSYIIKKSMLDFNNEKEKQYYSEKLNSNSILKDIQNIEFFFIWKMFIRIYFTISIIHKTAKSKP